MHCSILCVLAVQSLFLIANIATAKEKLVTTTITKTVLHGTSTRLVAHTSSASNGSPYSYSNLRSSVLNSTNHYRSQYLANPLAWDSTLAAYAYRHSQKCIFEHSGGPYGENLAGNFESPTLGVDAWAGEEKMYKYPNEGFSEDTGHWTQLVWQKTTHVGCGATNCDNDAENGAKGWYLVCEYSPPGNVEGEYVFNVQKAGMSDDGKLGFGEASAASSLGGWSSLLMVLVTASSLAVAGL